MASEYEIFLKRKSEDEELLALIRGLSSEDEDTSADAPPNPLPLSEEPLEEFRETVWQQEPILVPMKPVSPPSRAPITRENSDATLSIVEDYDSDSMKKYDPEGNEWIEDFLSNFNKVRLFKFLLWGDPLTLLVEYSMEDSNSGVQ